MTEGCQCLIGGGKVTDVRMGRAAATEMVPASDRVGSYGMKGHQCPAEQAATMEKESASGESRAHQEHTCCKFAAQILFGNASDENEAIN